MTVASAADPQAVVPIHSELLGTLSIGEGQMVAFSEGLYGFPEARQFALLPTGREGLFWLQSTAYSALVFLLVDPFVVLQTFHIELSDADLLRLGSNTEQDILVLSIVTMSTGPLQPCTANLQAPLLFNVPAGNGFQSIRSDEKFSMSTPFELA